LDFLGLNAKGEPLKFEAPDNDWSKRWELERAFRDAAQKAFYTLSFAEFDQVLEAWFPKLAPVVRKALNGVASEQPRSVEGWATQANHWRNATFEYEQPLEWFAEHAGYHWHWGSHLVPLYVTAIDAGNTTLLELFTAAALNEHPVAGMGDHVIQTLLKINHPESWTLIERLLLAAQRQEGLRQSIFAAIGGAHPEANRRLLYLILEHDLLRFSSSVQWATRYLPLLPPEPTPKVLETALRAYIERIENPQASVALLEDTDAEPDLNALFLARHTLERVGKGAEARRLLEPWLQHENPEKRLAALQLATPSEATLEELTRDPDDRVAIKAFSHLRFQTLDEEQPEAVALLEALYKRFPGKVEFGALTNWLHIGQINPENIVNSLYALTEKTNPRFVLRYKPHVSSWVQSRLIQTLTEKTPWEPDVRSLVVDALASQEQARDSAIAALRKHKVALSETEVKPLEKLLTRKTASTRQGLIQFLLEQPADIASSSAARLLSAKNPEQKKAGAEIQRELEVRQAERNKPTAVNGYGLFDPAKRSPAFPLEAKPVRLVTPAALKCLESLEALIESLAQTTIEIPYWDGSIQAVPFGNHELSGFDARSEKSLLEQYNAMPLHDVWESWYRNRGADERDSDGLELLRAAIIRPWRFTSKDETPLEERADAYQAFYTRYFDGLPRLEPNSEKNHVGSNVNQVLTWLRAAYPVDAERDFKLDLLEDQLALMVPALEAGFRRFSQPGEIRPNHEVLKDDPTYKKFSNLTAINISVPDSLQPKSDAQKIRHWQLLHTMQLRLWWTRNRHTDLFDLMAAFNAGVASETDVMDALIGPSDLSPDAAPSSNHVFAQYMKRKPDPLLEAHPNLKPFLERCAEKALELELQRGDLSTPLTSAVGKMQYLEGTGRLMEVLQALGRDNIVRGAGGYYYYGHREMPRLELLSYLLRAIHPGTGETTKDFVKAVKRAGIPEQRLLELGLYAPQWVPFVAQAVGWKGLDEAMYWLLAHTKESGWSGNRTELEGWKAEMAQLTPLTTEDLMDGAVDVQWFNKVYKTLGEKHWAQLYECAKYTSSGTGHARAKQFADAMLGKLEESSVTLRVTEKRHQDSVRALGLLPLSKARDVALLKRYEVLQAFVKASKKFGSQRRQSEGLAARIGMENLARTAGYADPMRLEWAMELKAVSDLAKGAVTLKRDGTVFTLSVTDSGEPEFTVTKNGKTLKDIPAALKKDEAVLELRARKKELEGQRSRMRVSLERAMVHGDEFTPKELRDLCKHPIVKPMLAQLVFVDEDRLGFASSDGKHLIDAEGELLEIRGKGLRLAHPVDFFESKTWSAWQSAFFAANRQQPFKQIFRELYLMTEAERLEATQSSRYAGHQVNPQQSVALLGARGWVVPFEEDASRTFFAEGITARLSRRYGWTTPAEVEAPALDTVRFTKRNHWEPLKLEDIPKRLFSEVMRDLDLVVSVAHVGGVDPEASQSTTEMRAALMHETLRLLKLQNVRIDKQLAFIEGKLGRYSVHLGSAVVRQQPGWTICLVAVPNQDRGRVFLPFADSDPRTAEVIAKVIMLAKDSEIKDPILLRQLVG
jgi:hypothetical protein